MDLDEAKEFKERCTQCAAVSWGLTDEGKYYCTSCHNVTEAAQYFVGSNPGRGHGTAHQTTLRQRPTCHN
uniref:TATA-box binding protein associated factor, RNA polymerase I subunit B n=1 Tax=Equus asinus TaxID=9793 RepID=A0A9L0JIC8_EQUAS